MNYFILLVYLCLGVHALDQSIIDEAVKIISEIGLECAETENPSEEDMQNLMKQKAPVTHAGKCVISCTLKKMHILNDDGTYGPGYTELLQKIEADDPVFYKKFVGVWDTCKDKIKPQSDICETAFQFMACGKIEGLKNGIKVLL